MSVARIWLGGSLCLATSFYTFPVLGYRKNPLCPLSGIGLLTFAIRVKTPCEGIPVVLSTQSIAWGGGACWISLTGIRYFVDLPCQVYCDLVLYSSSTVEIFDSGPSRSPSSTALGLVRTFATLEKNYGELSTCPQRYAA